MALSTVTATVYAYPNGMDNTQRRSIVRGTLAISASPGTYPSGGFSLATVFKLEPIRNVSGVPAGLFVYSVSGSGYTYVWIRSTNKLMIQQGAASASNPNAEIPVAAIPAGVSGDTIEFEAEFQHNE
jgi:hypothetical protein